MSLKVAILSSIHQKKSFETQVEGSHRSRPRAGDHRGWQARRGGRRWRQHGRGPGCTISFLQLCFFCFLVRKLAGGGVHTARNGFVRRIALLGLAGRSGNGLVTHRRPGTVTIPSSMLACATGIRPLQIKVCCQSKVPSTFPLQHFLLRAVFSGLILFLD